MARCSPLSAAVLALLAAAPAAATVFVAMGDGELADRSPLIVEGRVLEAAAASAGGPAIDYRVAVEGRLKGEPPGVELVVRLPGGVSRDGLALALAGVPSFRPGDEVLLFLTPGGDGIWVPQQLFLGVFRTAESGGGRIATRDAGALHQLSAGRKTRPRDLAGFRRWLRDRARGAIRPADYFLAGDLPGLPESRDKYALVVSSTEPPPVGCGPSGGHPVRWFDFDDHHTIGWRSYFHGQPGVPGGGISELERALAGWSDDPNSAVALTYSGLTGATGGLTRNDGVSAVLFGDPTDAIPGTFDGSGILAIGGPWFSCVLQEYRGELYHPIVEGDVVTQDGLERFFAASRSPQRAAEELFAHELGHALGIAHTPDAEALMFATIHDDGRGAALDVDDLAALDALYGAGGLTRPAAPEDLAAVAETATRVRLSWSDASDDESNFRLERRSDGPRDGPPTPGEFALIAAVAADRTDFVDDGLSPEAAYTYRVRAQNGAGGSPYSGEAEVATPADPRPAAPSALRAAPISSQRVRLTWQDNSDDETSFVLEVRDPATRTFVEVPYAIPADTATLQVSELEPGTTYGFRVASRNAFGRSSPTDPVSVTTFADGAECETGSTALCLLGGRFRVELFFVDPRREVGELPATAVPSTDQIGLFWFFAPENIELIVKMLDGRNLNGHFWLYYGGVSDLEYRLEITDTESGRTVTYHSPRGEICGFADIEAFADADADPAAPTAPPPVAAVDPSALVLEAVPRPGRVGPKDGPGSCVPGPDTLCLLDRRLRIEVRWRIPHDGTEGVGHAIAAGDNSGYFWYFDTQNTELVVKALDGGALNGNLWIFYGALTDLEYWITVTDTFTGGQRVYYNPPGRICGRADIQAFAAAIPVP